MWSLRTSIVRFIRPRPKDSYIRNIITAPVTPPGLKLKLPAWTVDQFFKQVGGDLGEYAEKFEKLEQVFECNKYQLKERGIPPRKRKYIFRVRELLRRGVVTFESLEKRTAVPTVKEKVAN